MKKLVATLILSLCFLVFTAKIEAAPSLGIHLLDPNELEQAVDLIGGDPQTPGAVTVVLRTDDRDGQKWQHFFDVADQQHVTPIIRLATQMSQEGWRRPTRRDIVEHAAFLSGLDWHADRLVVVAFNEPNHAQEWGGQVDPAGYASSLEFTADWFHTEPKHYAVLPAGLDAAAPNGNETRDSFAFINQMLAQTPGILDKIDGWVSHAYPNPGFVASPYNSGKQSIRGYRDEIELLSQFTKRELDVYITETGWKRTPGNAHRLADFYTYAVEEVWDDERIRAITPFVFAAHNGPFQDFSFINPDGSATPQYTAWKLLKEEKLKLPLPDFLAHLL